MAYFVTRDRSEILWAKTGVNGLTLFEGYPLNLPIDDEWKKGGDEGIPVPNPPGLSYRFLSCGDSTVFGLRPQGPRAFLSVPRTDLTQPFTLVEAPWPERPKHPPLKTFPMRGTQKIGECSEPQSVVCTDSDGLSLVVLDTGLENLCPPKILAYDSITGKKVASIELASVRGSRLRTLVSDSGRAYVGEPAESTLLVCDLASLGVVAAPRRCWLVELVPPPEPGAPIPSSALLALSGQSLFLASDRHDRAYRANATSLRVFEPPTTPETGLECEQAVEARLDVVIEGVLLGRPSTILVDKHGGLVYCSPQHWLCARWPTRLPLAAESQEIILQSGDLSDVDGLFLDSRHIWAVLPRTTTNLQCKKLT